MLRKFIWFATGIPQSLVIHGEQFGVLPLETKGRALLANAMKTEQSLATVFQSAADIVEIVQLTDAADAKEAFESSYHVATRIVDVYSFLTIQRPALLPTVCIHEDGQAMSELLLFEFEGTGVIYAGDKMRAAVDAMHRCVFDRILPAFDVAVGHHNKAHSELGQKIASATRMFHHGREAKDTQVQFLCYFTAFETIVCGSRLYGHGRLLMQRIPKLFRNTVTADQVAELWKIRCGVAHEGAGTWASLTQALPTVKQIATACLLFAVDQLKVTDSIESMWDSVQQYHSPPEIMAPESFFAFPAQSAVRKLCTIGMISPKIETSSPENGA